MSDQTPDQPARPPWAPVNASEDRTGEPTPPTTEPDDSREETPPAPPPHENSTTEQQAPHPYAPGPTPAPPAPPASSTPAPTQSPEHESTAGVPASPYMPAPDRQPFSPPPPAQDSSPPPRRESPLPWERPEETAAEAPTLSPYSQADAAAPQTPAQPSQPERTVPPWEQPTPASATPEPERTVPPWEQPTPASATPEPPPWRDEPAPSAPPMRPQFRSPEPSSPPPVSGPQPTVPDDERVAEPAPRESPAPWDVPDLAEPTPQDTPRDAASPPAETSPADASQPAWAALDEQLNPPQARAPSPPPFTATPDAESYRPQNPGVAEQVPEPIDIDTDDDDNLRQPTSPPPPEETFPATGRTRGSLFPSAVSPYEHTQDGGPTGAAHESPHDDGGGFQSLGQSAVTNASLSAGGAHTPMGGVPLASSRPDRDPSGDDPGPQFGTDEPAFTPRFAPADPAPTGEQPTVRFAPVSGEHQVYDHVASDHASPQTAPVGHDAPPTIAYPGAGDTTPDAPEGGVADHHADEAHVPWWRSTVALVIYGLLVMSGLAYGAYYVLLAPEPIALEAPVLLEGPPDNGITPIEIENPTPFLEAIPTGTLTHSLIEIETFEPGELTDLPARTVEAHDLTYSDAEDTYVVRAIQHYNEDDAIANYEALAGDASDVAPVEANGSPVGERAILDTDEGTIIVWRNETAVLTLTGPESGSLDFYTYYDL